MSGAQLEYGYTRIANELLEQIIGFGFSKNQLLVLLHIIRKTYGYNKKVDDMTVAQISAKIGLDRANVSRSLAELVAIGAVLKQHGNYGYLLEINKNYKQWLGVSKQHARVKTTRGACQNNTGGVSKQHTQKTTPKDNSKRNIGDFDSFYAAYPKKRGKEAAIKAWQKIAPDENLMGEIMAALEVQKRTAQWLKNSGEFIPYPATWLNQKRWQDEVESQPVRRLAL